MKYTLSSQEYNDMFKKAADTFNEEMAKRDILIHNMSKKLMIINYANEFIENYLNKNLVNSPNRITTFGNDLGGSFNQYGYVIHPKFKTNPIDIFNLKLMTGQTMFKNSLVCKVNGVEGNEDNGINDMYSNILVSDNSIEKKIFFEELTDRTLTIEYVLNNRVSLGMTRFNVIEIDPYIYGAYTLKGIDIYSLDEYNGTVAETPLKSISRMDNIGKTRIILDEKVKFSKVVFTFDLESVKTQKNNVDVYPFGLKHIHFYEADFLEESTVIVPIVADDYIEYIYNDIILYNSNMPIYSTTDYYGIEFYTDYINNTLTGKVYASSDAAAYRIAKNTKVLYAKVPLIWSNNANTDKQYLSLSGIYFNYTVDENTFI